MLFGHRALHTRYTSEHLEHMCPILSIQVKRSCFFEGPTFNCTIGVFLDKDFLDPPPPLKSERIELGLLLCCRDLLGLGPTCLTRLWACWVSALRAQTQQAQTWRLDLNDALLSR